jgi:hypothetical protein
MFVFQEKGLLLMDKFLPDLLITDYTGNPIAVVEVKSRDQLPVNVATEIRSNMLKRGLPAHVPYMLLLTQDEGYLWKGSERPNPDAPPLYHFPMKSVISRYSLREPEQRLYPTELELLVLHWLTNLIAKKQEYAEEPEKTLAQAGFNDSIKDGIVLIEEAL